MATFLYHHFLKSADTLPKAQPGADSYWLHISYFLQNCKKGKPSKKDLPLLENDITTFELALKYGIHSSKHKFQIDDFDPKRNHFRVVW